MRLTVTASAERKLIQNFCRSTFCKPIGESPRIQMRRPSRLNCGKTKRVVRVESVSAEAARLRSEIIASQNGV